MCIWFEFLFKASPMMHGACSVYSTPISKWNWYHHSVIFISWVHVCSTAFQRIFSLFQKTFICKFSNFSRLSEFVTDGWELTDIMWVSSSLKYSIVTNDNLDDWNSQKSLPGSWRRGGNHVSGVHIRGRLSRLCDVWYNDIFVADIMKTGRRGFGVIIAIQCTAVR